VQESILLNISPSSSSSTLRCSKNSSSSSHRCSSSNQFVVVSVWVIPSNESSYGTTFVSIGAEMRDFCGVCSSVVFVVPWVGGCCLCGGI